MGVDIVRQHARLDFRLRRPQRGIVEDPGDAGRRLAGGSGLALDLATALDAALDQLAHGETYVGLEGLYAARMQAIANAGHIGRRLCFEHHDRRTVEGMQRRGARLRRTR